MATKSTKNYTLMPLGEILLDLEYISPVQWEAALATAAKHGREFQKVLLDDKTIDVDQLTHASALQNGLRYWDAARIRNIVGKYGLTRKSPPKDAPAFDHIAWAKKGGPCLIAISDLGNSGARAQLKAAYQAVTDKVEIVAVTPETMASAARSASAPGAAQAPKSPTAKPQEAPQPAPRRAASEEPRPKQGGAQTAGTSVDGYRIEQRLAAGAAGVVYLATRQRDGTRVALKRLHPELATNERAVQQMVSERQMLERFDHPGIIRVYGGGVWDGVPYFAMELMPGESLADRLASGELLSIPTIISLWCQIADALAYAHRMGILHRDVKPANVLLTAQGEAKVVDFGIARTGGGATDQSGTMLYMAPEQLRGQSLTPAADIYALGILAFEMLTGALPDGHLDLQIMIRRRQQRDISFDDVRRPLTQAVRVGSRMQEVGASLTDFARILHRCLRKNPRDRFRSAEALSKNLRQIMKLRGWPAPVAPPLPAPHTHAWASDETVTDDATTAPVAPSTDGDETAVASLISGPPPTPEVAIPDDYEVIRPLGRGSMGEVFLARDRDTGRQVALKMIAPEMAANKRFRDRFQREAEVLGRLQHPSIVHIYGVQFEGPTPHIAMEYVEGRDLEEVLKERGRLTYQESVHIITQAASALEHVHSHGVIHRDLKPSNLMLTTTGEVKILDFGVAKDTEGADLTKMGAVIGTPHYMSPEQAAGKPAQPLSDMYALGLIWYQLLVGKVPFRGSIPEVLHQHVAIQPPRVRESVDVPERADRVIARMLRKEADERPQSFKEVIRVAEEAAASASIFSRLWYAVAPVLLLALGGSVLGYGYQAASEDWALDLMADWWSRGLMYAGGACVALGALTFLWRLLGALFSGSRG